ncbi:MAG: cytochrome c biogenesis protein CcsA [Gammaproteobacteria bacterium]
MQQQILFVLTVALYLATTAMVIWQFLGSQLDRRKHFVLIPGFLALAAHGLVLHTALFTPAGLNLSIVSSLSVAAWLVAAVVLLSALRAPTENLGILVFPLAGVSIGLLFFFSDRITIVENASWQLQTHILVSLVAYSLLTVAAIQALVLAFQESKLRGQNPGGILLALPPLQTMESLLFQLLWSGFVLLSLALFSGLVFVHDLFAQHLVHKTVLSILAWLIFGTLLWGRRKFGWRGRTAIRWTLGGFTVLLLAYFGSKLVLEILLDRHWG